MRAGRTKCTLSCLSYTRYGTDDFPYNKILITITLDAKCDDDDEPPGNRRDDRSIDCYQYPVAAIILVTTCLFVPGNAANVCGTYSLSARGLLRMGLNSLRSKRRAKRKVGDDQGLRSERAGVFRHVRFVVAMRPAKTDDNDYIISVRNELYYIVEHDLFLELQLATKPSRTILNCIEQCRRFVAERGAGRGP
jgi:hypothetical protein